MPKKIRLISQLSIIVFSFLFYGTTLKNGYSLDDYYVIEDNPRVQKGISGIPNIFASHYVENQTQSFGYRPVTLATFALEYEFFGETPSISHLINVLLYILTCLLLLHILSHLFRDYHWLLPLLSVGFFLIHPIHTEVVNNIKSRDELLSFFFALNSLWFAVRFIRKKGGWNLLVAFLFLVVSLLSKMSSLTFLAIIPLTLYFFENVSFKKLGFIFLSLLVIFIGFKIGSNLLLETETKSRELLFIENPFFTNNTSFFNRIPMAFYTIGYYVKLLLYPYPLLFYYGYAHVPLVGWDSFSAWVSILILVPLGVYTVLKLKTKSVLIYGLAYFFIAISMYSNLVKPAVGIIAERFVYVPSLGFSIVVAALSLKALGIIINKEVSNFKKKQIKVLLLFSFFTVLSLPYVLKRNSKWDSKFTLVKNDVQYLKKSAKANELLGDYYLVDRNNETDPIKKKRIMDRAIICYNNSIKVYPNNGYALNNLGVLHQEIGNTDRAITYYKEAHKNGINAANSYFNLAMAYYQKKEYANAIASFEKSIEIDHTYSNSYNQLINLYVEMEQIDTALAVNINALVAFPESREQIIKVGQQIAEIKYGKNTDYYINLLLTNRVIDTTLHQKFKEKLVKSKNN